MKLILTNIVYGKTHVDLFFDRHLPSILDESNIPRVKHMIDKYIIFTDQETKPLIESHPRLRELLSLVEVQLIDFSWRPNVNRFDLRYSVLVNTFRMAAKEAHQRGSLLSAWTADMIIAKDCLPKLLAKMDDGFDAVLLHPARCAYESSSKEFDGFRLPLNEQPGAMYASDLWKICQRHPHPYLSVANHWRCPNFTKYPFYIHWSTVTGYMTRSFATTPIIMRTTEAMQEVKQVIDIEVPGMFMHPYWADDFDEFGVIQAEPIMCYSDAFTPAPPQLKKMRAFAKERHAHQRKTFQRKLYYPNRFIVQLEPAQESESDLAVNSILHGIEEELAADTNQEEASSGTKT